MLSPVLGPVIEPLTPLLVIEEVGYDSAGQPVLHSLEYYPSQSMRFELIRRRGAHLSHRGNGPQLLRGHENGKSFVGTSSREKER
jgi:hypothetical protein